MEAESLVRRTRDKLNQGRINSLSGLCLGEGRQGRGKTTKAGEEEEEEEIRGGKEEENRAGSKVERGGGGRENVGRKY